MRLRSVLVQLARYLRNQGIMRERLYTVTRTYFPPPDVDFIRCVIFLAVLLYLLEQNGKVFTVVSVKNGTAPAGDVAELQQVLDSLEFQT